jgi:N6-L-threonylcarbamoyladenine synthase
MLKETSRHVIEHPLRPELEEIFSREPELFARFVTDIPHYNPPEIDAIAVTEGPGLEPALWTGVNLARALSLIWKKPVFGVNHMEGHFFAGLLECADGICRLPEPDFPVLGLLVSGGHTELVLMRGYGVYEVVGETRDDAAGEAFDKVARILGLPYPGGPEIAKLALEGTPGIHPLPRPMLHSGDLNFSFSGLKTAVLYLVRELGALSEIDRRNIAREFEEAAVDVLVTKTVRAAKEFGVKRVVLGGGVSANKRLRETMIRAVNKELFGVLVSIPEAQLTTDNALMIGAAGLWRMSEHRDDHGMAIVPKGNLRLG